MPSLGSNSGPQKLMLVAGLHLSLGLVLWAYTGGWSELYGYYFTHVGSAFLISFAFLELAFALRVRKAFQPGEELYRAWTAIMVGAALRLVGVFVAHGLQPDARVRDIGIFVSGPLALGCLAWGLRGVLRLYRTLGYSVRLQATDWFLVAGCAAMAVSGVIQNMISPSSGFITDVLLCLLLFQAILLKRSVSQMGGGLVAACWTAYVVAIFLTALGDLGITLVAYGFVPDALLPATWLIWYPAAASFALGPAFLSQAVYLATQSAAKRQPVSRRPKVAV
ncbi:MAG TPA: hypothetical protein VER03_17005 [Bryobacteraceae bacterium]|nr:hypothetical protein [Bryobacteraceae bacterium]